MKVYKAQQTYQISYVLSLYKDIIVILYRV